MEQLTNLKVNPAEQLRSKQIFGHPIGISIVLLTETWERFSYYGMRSIVLLYLYQSIASGGLGIPEDTAITVTSLYGALVYFSSLLGGFIADRIISKYRTVLIGGCLMILGHVFLAIPSTGIAGFFASMVCIIFGSGFLKTNVSVMVGELYEEKDSRRDTAFNLLYFGINIGAFLAPIVVGTVKDIAGFNIGFLCAGLGMLVGMICYISFGHKMVSTKSLQVPNPLKKHERKYIGVALGGFVVLVLGFWGVFNLLNILTIDNVLHTIGIVIVVVPVIYFIFTFTSSQITKQEKLKVSLIVAIFLSYIVQCSVSEQISTTMTDLAQNHTDNLFPADWILSINAITILIISPLVALGWQKLSDKGVYIPITIKSTVGLVFCCLSMLNILFAIITTNNGKFSSFVIIVTVILFTLGEMLVYPVGLEAVSRLAPSTLKSQFMGIFLIGNAVGQSIISLLSDTYETNRIVYFVIFIVISGIFSLVMFSLTKVFTKFNLK